MQLCRPHDQEFPEVVAWKDRKALASDLKTAYHASSEDEARENLAGFAGKWEGRFSMIQILAGQLADGSSPLMP